LADLVVPQNGNGNEKPQADATRRGSMKNFANCVNRRKLQQHQQQQEQRHQYQEIIRTHKKSRQ